MKDFLVAVGLVFTLEGIIFAAFPEQAKRAMASVIGTEDAMLRVIGIASSLFGLIVIWLIRG